MSFIDPLFLLAGLLAALPIAIHLINRRRAARQDFPAIQFLLKSKKKVARGARIRQMLLLILRVLVVMLLVLAIAKPYCEESASDIAGAQRLPTARVFVVDTGFSSQWGDWWTRIERTFQSQLAGSRPWDEVALVTTRPRHVPIDRLTSDHAQVRRAFGQLEPGDHAADLGAGLDAAAEILSASALPNRQIIVISPFTERSVSDSWLASADVGYDMRLENVRRSGEEIPANLAITQVEYEQETTGQESVWRIVTTVRNFGDEDVNEVELRLTMAGEVVGASRIDVPSGQQAAQTFRHRVEGAGLIHGTVELIDADRLSADNRRDFSIHLEDRIRVLIVNGEPSSNVYRDEVFFLERALRPGADSESLVVPVVTTREGFEERSLEGFDVVVLANVTRVSQTAGNRLYDFVKKGGGLFMTMGQQVDVENWNQNMGLLLPKPLRSHRQLAEPGDPDAPIKITRLEEARRQHPIFQVFNLPGGETLQSVKVYSYMLLEPTPPEPGVTTLLSYRDAAPALMERELERGRVLLWTTSIDLDWTDMPIRTSYLPLVRRSMQYLARRATSETISQHRVMDRISLEVGSVMDGQAEIRRPDGERQVIEPIDGTLIFDAPMAGIYEVRAMEDGEWTRLDHLTTVVHLDTRASDLRSYPMDQLRDSLAQQGSEVRYGSDAAERKNVWPILLFLVTLVLLAESILGTRRSVLLRIARSLKP